MQIPGNTQVDPPVGACPRFSTEALAPVAAALAGLVAAWVAAGSTGLLAHPLRRAMTLLFLAVAIFVRRPLLRDRPRTSLALLPLVLAVGACMVTLPLPAANVMAAAVVLAYLALTSGGQSRVILLTSSIAVAVFGTYRFAVTSVPWLWLAADFVSRNLAAAAGRVVGRPLWTGSTFAGLDFLILTSVLWGLYLPHTQPPRAARALYGFAAILAGHLTCLVLVAHIPDLLAILPVDGANPALQLAHRSLPWNVPALVCGLHALIVAAMLRWAAWIQTPEPRRARGLGLTLVAIAAALLLPVVVVPRPGLASLEGRKIVLYEKGFLNWLKPAHGSYGRLSSGMYGMLPVLLESLGAKCLVSPDLAEADLKDADVLTIIFPDEPWQEGQLDRIHQFVRRGGSLLVLGEHTTGDPNGSNRFNEVLAPTAMRVRFDCATFAVGGWLQSYEPLLHPATAGIADDQNQFGVVIGASVAARWPARPLLVGRWGWIDDGDETSDKAQMGNERYDGGEKLGDVVLAAEQPLGKGRIIAFGDTSGLTNAISVSSYEFTSRLFSYLAGGASAHGAFRQLADLLTTAMLILLLCRRPGVAKTLLAAIALTASVAACTLGTHGAASLLPDGRRVTPNNLAYIDASHIEAYSGESWRPDGIGGLALTLMRSGYLALDLPELTPERLERAGLLLSIAPARRFSSQEAETVKTFVSNGGAFILMTGYEQRAPCLPLLEAFGLRVGLAESPDMEPPALGHFKSPYLESDSQRVYVRFHAAWPVACDDPNSRVIAYGRDNLPVIVLRRFGKGTVLLIGDPCFATNMNLEYENGAPFEGLRENADFWRWLLSMLRGEPMWIPPALQSASSGEAGS